MDDGRKAMSKAIQTFRDLPIYRDACTLQQDIFDLSKKWPREETYSLTDQARRSSRSVGANIAEAWAKRRYEAHFISKLTDADAELQETYHWLETAYKCNYLKAGALQALTKQAESIGRQLGAIIRDSDSFCA